MRKLESVLDNVTHKILWDLAVQTVHQILARKLDHVIIKKNKKEENMLDSVLCRPTGLQSENRRETQVLRPCKRAKKKLWNIVIGAFGTIPIILLKGLDVLKIGGRAETIQTTEYWIQPEYWEDSWRLAVTQTPVKTHQLTPVWKTHKE